MPPSNTSPSRSRLSLVEEKLSMITHEFNNIKSETGSTVSSQTDFGVQVSGQYSNIPELHDMVRFKKQFPPSQSYLDFLLRVYFILTAIISNQVCVP